MLVVGVILKMLGLYLVSLYPYNRSQICSILSIRNVLTLQKELRKFHVRSNSVLDKK